jgi:hypothetical protein
MKLTQRQLDKISSLINEEAEVRKNLHESMYESRKQSVVQENFLFEDANPDDMPEQLVSALDDEITNFSQEILNSTPRVSLNKIVYKELSNMYFDMTGKSVDVNILMDNLQEFNAYELEMELMTDIKLAIDRYVLALGKLAVEESGVNSPEGME